MNNEDYQAAFDIRYTGTREQVLQLLADNDSNGCYTDADCDLERLPHIPDAIARAMLDDILSEGF